MSRHDELRATWAPGQYWETASGGYGVWVPVGNGGNAEPLWDEHQEYRRRADLEQPGAATTTEFEKGGNDALGSTPRADMSAEGRDSGTNAQEVPQDGGMRAAMIKLSRALGHPKEVEAGATQCIEAALIELAVERLTPGGSSKHGTSLTGAELIAAERRRQIEQEGWTPDHDDEHEDGSLALAAVCYASPEPIYLCDIDGRATVRFVDPWPDSWDSEWDKRSEYGNADETESGIADPGSYTPEQRLDLLVKAGALIAAEIDRQKRALGVKEGS